ncbi:unnamed protein product [Rotaria sp. Silwood2]|nr:unnamed protein product [Rotaria sp. Silwood2]CAF4549407.1 unnamed protein product [Rotaria sp. Silwood2]
MIMGRAKVSLEKRTEIKALVEAGFNQRLIAKGVGVSKTCVFGVEQKLKQNLPLLNLPGQGRKKASTATDDRNLLRLCKKGRTKSSQELSSELVLSNGKRLSTPTIRRQLVDMGYSNYTAKRKPYRKPSQRRQRLSFARQHQYWVKEWNNIIWSDEAHFEVLNRKNRTFARRLQNESNEPFNFLPKMQGDAGIVSVC